MCAPCVIGLRRVARGDKCGSRAPAPYVRRMSAPVRIGLLSDLHGFLPESADLPALDLLLLGGDLCADFFVPHGGGMVPHLSGQERWAEQVLGPWLAEIQAGGRVGQVIGICGNHDFLGEHPRGDALLRRLPWTYLRDESVVADCGLRVFGSPWTPTFFNWAFMADDQLLANRWAAIPAETDILVTHGPALGQLDRTPDGRAVGSGTLRLRLNDLPQVKLHLCGHIHAARGALDWYGERLTVNAAAVDEAYDPVGQLHVVSWQAEGLPLLEQLPLPLQARHRD